MKVKRNLRLYATGLLAGFGLQFLVGMALNLFVQLPTSHPGTTGNEYFSRSGHSLVWALSGNAGLGLAIHVYIALALVLGTLALFLRSLAVHNKQWTWVGLIAFIFTLGALFNGLSFVDYSHNVSSMVMASCWLIAVISLIVGIFYNF
jgi:hypothetical protein